MAEYEHRLVAYFDVLGWESFVARSADQPELIDTILAALTSVPHGPMPKFGTDDIENSAISLNQFSDSIVASLVLEPSDPNLSTIIYNYFCLLAGVSLLLLSSGFPVRGGIADGKLYHQKKHVFGPALNEAVRLERTKAIYPRIVIKPSDDGLPLSPAARQLLNDANEVYRADWRGPHRTGHRTRPELIRYVDMDILSHFLRPDDDGMLFLDFMSQRQNIPKHVDLLVSINAVIAAGLESHKCSPGNKEYDPSIHQKYQWLRKYIDRHSSVDSPNTRPPG